MFQVNPTMSHILWLSSKTTLFYVVTITSNTRDAFVDQQYLNKIQEVVFSCIHLILQTGKKREEPEESAVYSDVKIRSATGTVKYNRFTLTFYWVLPQCNLFIPLRTTRYVSSVCSGQILHNLKSSHVPPAVLQSTPRGTHTPLLETLTSSYSHCNLYHISCCVLLCTPRLF